MSTSASKSDKSRKRQPLSCEFSFLHGCPRTFAFNDAESWITHMVKEHLQAKLPERSACWYCDRVTFHVPLPLSLQFSPSPSSTSSSKSIRQARQAHQGALLQTYRTRMLHIRDSHLAQGAALDGRSTGSHPMKPDPAFLSHLHQHGLISEGRLCAMYSGHLKMEPYSTSSFDFQSGIVRRVGGGEVKGMGFKGSINASQMQKQGETTPPCADIYPCDFEPPGRAREMERLAQVPFDQAREDRRARREKRSSKYNDNGRRVS